MLEIITAIFLTLMGSALYHLLPSRMVRLRMTWVVVLSFLIVLAHFPVAAMLATACGGFTWLLYLAGQRIAVVKKYGPFSLIILLLVFSVKDFHVNTDTYSATLLQFGMSFYILRLYLALRTAATRKQEVRLEEFLVIALFFPIFPAGPICAQEAFTRSTVQERPLLQNYALGIVRLGIGIFALYFVTDALGSIGKQFIVWEGFVVNWQGMGAAETYLAMLLSFLDLYANFVGYTEIAIGLGLFFGFEVPENFRYPFLATNIQKFWQRWHLSLSRFITNQIYLPLMLSLRKPRVCMFLAFVLVGMWHKVTPQYLIWGVGHGAMMVAYMSYSGSALSKGVSAALPTWLWAALSWWITISLVAFFSTFANQPLFALSLSFAQSLIPGL